MERRVEFNGILVNALVEGGMSATVAQNRVYFQPPENLVLNFPCIVYEFSGDSPVHADNLLYGVLANRYKVTLIDRNPDSAFYEPLRKIKMTSGPTHFVSDNLHHYVFTMNY